MDAETEDDPEPLAPAAEGLARGTAVGRFLILGELGAGGMGVVYEAYDPQLDRRVAIKIVRRDRRRGAVSEARLTREARAMARLSAREVVAVFDAGTHAGSTFIAMELVDGESLERRLQRPAQAPEVLRWLVDAGRGLAAAHDAGIVHRDFKPANVLISRDGRAKVTDFGLAISDDEAPEPADDRHVEKDLTQTGALLGTPRYMAPEQVTGSAVAASDQFAFALTAWRALGGSDPFGEELGPARSSAIAAGRLQPSAREIGKLRPALTRALAADPTKRWPSMHELVARLDRRGPSWVPLAIGGSLTAVAAVGITLAVRGAPAADAPDCAAAGSLAGTWDDAARDKLATTLAPLATTGDRVRDTLDAYARRWTAARVDACEATLVRRTQSDEAMDLRMRCLDERRRDLTALLAATEKGAPTPKLVDAAFALPPIERCARVELLRLTGEPQDPEARRRAGEVRDRLREAKVAYDLARYADGKPLVDGAVATAGELRANALRAEAMYWQGRFLGQLGDAAGSETTLRAAARIGEAARADEIVAHARTALVFVIALQQKEFARVDAWVADAEAAIARIGGDPALTARLHLNRGAVLETGSGRSKEALEEFRAAEAAYRALAGKDDPDVARSLTNAGTSLWTLRRLDEAEATMKRALAIYEASFGDRHPQIGQTLINLSGVARGRGDRPAAVAYAQRAVDVLTASLGGAHPTTATSLNNLAHTLFFAGRHDDALAIYERSQTTLRANKANPTQIAQGDLVIANIHAQRGRLAEAEKVLDEAQQLYDQTYGADSPDAQIPRLSRAEIRIGKNALTGVAAELDRVAAALAKTPDARLAPYVTRDRGLLASAEGRHADAVKLLESVVEASFLDATDAAEAHYGLAKALVAASADRDRALTLARRARAAYAAAEGEQGRNVTSLDAWIAGLRSVP